MQTFQHHGARAGSGPQRWLFAATLSAGLCATWAESAQAGAVIFNSLDPAFQTVALGVNDLGHLNFVSSDFAPTNSDAAATGLAARFPDGSYRDATSPGCLCEGWGLAVTFDGFRTSGFANESAGSGGLTGGSFGATTTAATSVVGLASAPVQVTHSYGVSLAPGVFQGNITIKNNGISALQDVVYRRVMDWDVPPTEFNEFVSHYGVAANLESAGGNVRFASNDGFATSNPMIPGTSIDPASINADFVDLGPNDHGSLFDFAFGDIAAGESRTFNIFYGAAANEAEADAAIAILKPNVWSYGQSMLGDPGVGTGCEPECSVPTADVGTLGVTPNNDGTTFIFAFGGVGGVEPGIDPEAPVLPFVPAPGQFVFPAPVPRRWYDPPMAEGFEYSLDDGEFLSVMIADGFGSLTLVADGFTAVLDPLKEYSFQDDFGLDDVHIFRILGLNPLVDAANPSAFPTFLDFQTSGPLHMTAIEPAPVPVPGGLPLLLSGLLVTARLRRRKLH